MRDVYGYWLFLLGCLAGLSGIIIYLIEQALFPGDLAIREVAIIAAAVGLPLALVGIVVLLPVRRNGIFASLLGMIVAFVGIGLFSWAYPHAWYVPPDYSAEIIAVYGAGITVIAVVAALVPIITGERGLLVEPELGLGRDEPPILLGQSSRDAFFAIFETPANEWTWRMIRRDAIAEGADRVRSDTDARMIVENVRGAIGHAGLLDLTMPSFRLYRTDGDAWRWSLVREDGSVVAIGETAVQSRDEVESTVTFLKEYLPSADMIDIHGAAFDVFEDEADRWQWRLVDDQRRPLASAPESLPNEQDAVTGAEAFADRFADARVLALEHVGFELVETEHGWRWRVVTPSDDILVESESAFDDRQTAESAAGRVADAVVAAPTVEYDTAGFELVPQPGGWTWRLRSEADELVLHRAGDPAEQSEIEARARRTRDVLGDATVLEFEGVDYEVYPVEEEWRWRLVSAEREVLAESAERFSDADTASAAADHVQERVLAAELIEFDRAAFQQYEFEGEWRWRLIDEDGQVLADSGEEYGSKEAVREGMTTLKEHAPDAEVLEIETAAFEIYRGEGDTYAWRLIDEGGNLIAEGATIHESRADARGAVDFLTETVDAADIRPMETAAFQLFRDGGGWATRLIDVDGQFLAHTTSPATTRDEIRERIDRIRHTGDGASIDTLAEITVALRNSTGWSWELLTPDRDRIAAGSRTYESRAAAEEDISLLTDTAADAPTFTVGDGIVWVTPAGPDEEWDWRLVAADRAVLGAATATYDDLDSVLEVVETIKTRAPDADRFEIETAAFEAFHDDETWNWRVLDEDEAILAVGPGEHETREDLADAIERAREASHNASILDIDEPAFEFHERDDGWVWRLIDEHGTPLAESVEVHPSRQEAREEMLSAKEFGPGGEAVVTW